MARAEGIRVSGRALGSISLVTFLLPQESNSP
jgi:hypothetical protein